MNTDHTPTLPGSVLSILDEKAGKAGDLIFLSGITASDPGVGIPDHVIISDEYPYYGSEIQKQTRYALEKIRDLLEEQGSSLSHVVKTQVFIPDCRLFDGLDQVWKQFFPTPPPRSCVAIGADNMTVPGTLVQIDIIAVPSQGTTQPREVESKRLAKPLANYTACVDYGGWLFLAGQLPTGFGPTALAAEAQLDPRFPHHGSSIANQTRFTMQVCQTLLEDSGSDWDHVVRAHVFLTDMSELHDFEEVWREKFETPPPFTVVEVSELLTGGARIEIDLIAIRPDSGLEVEFIRASAELRSSEGYFDVAKVGNHLFLSGQIPSGTSGELAETAAASSGFPFRESAIARQTDFVLERCDSLLKLAGSSLGDTVKLTTYLTTTQDIFNFGRSIVSHFETPPAMTTVVGPADELMVSGGRIAVDLVASISQRG